MAGAEHDGGGVSCNDVEHADYHACGYRRALNGAFRVARLFGQWRRSLEADEGLNGVHCSGEYAEDPFVSLNSSETETERRPRVRGAGNRNQPGGKEQENTDLDGAEDGADPGTHLNAIVAEQQNDDGGSDERCDPDDLVRLSPAGRHHTSDLHAGHEGNCRPPSCRGERVTPSDQETDSRMKGPCGIGVDAAGRRKMLRQLTDRNCDGQTWNECENHRQGESAAGKCGTNNHGDS